MRRKKSSTPKAPRRKKITVTTSCAEKQIIIVFKMDDDFDSDTDAQISLDKLASGKERYLFVADHIITTDPAKAAAWANKNAREDDRVYFAHICAITEQKLEKWPGAGC